MIIQVVALSVMGSIGSLRRYFLVTKTSRESRLLAIAASLNINAAILVTRMLGLHNVSGMTEKSGGSLDAPWRGRQLTDSDGRVWTELSLAQLVRDERFLTVNR